MDSITQLRSLGLILAKRWRIDADGGLTSAAYEKAKHFAVVEHEVSSLVDLAQVLGAASSDSFSCMIRGRPEPTCDVRRTRRLGVHFQDVPRRWSMHDFDAIECPDWLDWRADPVAAADHVRSLLPSQFHETTCWWSFTGSQGLKPGLRMRLAFWHDVPLSGADLKIWLCEREPVAGKPAKSWPQVCPVDGSIYGHVQPIYTAKPILDNGVSDPVPVRSGILHGRRDVVPTPVPITPRFTARVHSTSGHSGAPPSLEDGRSGYEYHRGRIGDHEDGFHRPMRAALAAWIARNGADADPAPAISDLAAAAWAVCPTGDPARRAEVENRIAALPRVAEWIREKQRESERRDGAIGSVCPAPVPLPTSSLLEAQAELAAAAHTAFLRCRGYFATHRDSELVAGTALHLIGACGLGAAALFAGPPRMAIGAGIGIGKTEAVIREAVKLIDDQPATRIAFAVPTHKTGDDICGRINAVAGRQLAKVWRGAASTDPSSSRAGMCRVPDLVARIQAAGGSIHEVCGGPERGWCRHNPRRPGIAASDACAYRQQADSNVAIWIVPHAMLTSAPPQSLPPLDMLVIDEAPWLSLFGGLDAHNPVRLRLSELLRPRILGGPSSLFSLLYQNAVAMLSSALHGHTGLLKRAILVEAGLSTWLARMCAGQIWLAKSKLAVRRDLPEPEAVAEFDRSRSASVPVALLARAWALIADFLESGEHVAPWTLELEHNEADGAWLRLRWRSAIHTKWSSGPVLCLDATPQPDVIRLWLPDLSVLTTVRARETNVFRVQVLDRPNGKITLLGSQDDRAAERGRKTRELRRYIECLAFRYRGQGASGGPDIAVVTYKQLADQLGAGSPANVAFGHFNALRGYDGWRGVAVIVVIGRPLPAARDVGIMSAVASGVITDAIALTYKRDVPGAVVMRDGSGRRVQTIGHPDPLVDAFRKQVLSEVEQAEGRARGVRRLYVSPLLSIVLTSQPTSLIADEAAMQADVFDRISIVDELAARGILPDNAADAARVLSEGLNRSAETGPAIRQRLSREGQAGVLSRIVTGHDLSDGESVTVPYNVPNMERSHSRSLGSEPPLETFKTFNCYRYRRSGCRQSASALIDIQTHSNPRPALESYLGELDVFERIGTPAWLAEIKGGLVRVGPELFLSLTPSVETIILGTDHRNPSDTPQFLPVATDILSITRGGRPVVLHVYETRSGAPLMLFRKPSACWPPRAPKREDTCKHYPLADQVFALNDVAAAADLPWPQVRELMKQPAMVRRASEIGFDRAGIEAVEHRIGRGRLHSALAQISAETADSSGRTS